MALLMNAEQREAVLNGAFESAVADFCAHNTAHPSLHEHVQQARGQWPGIRDAALSDLRRRPSSWWRLTAYVLTDESRTMVHVLVRAQPVMVPSYLSSLTH